MMCKPVFSLLFCLLLTTAAFSQVRGIITDEAGNALPFASVHVHGTSNGTSANEAGVFQFTSPKVGDTLVFRYIGFIDLMRVVETANEDLGSVSLSPRFYELGTIEVRADAEDPAYPIIRAAQEKRRYYLNRFGFYSCDVYIKGTITIDDAPEMLFGNEISIDELGIIYLSETKSRLTHNPPNGYREEIIHARTSGSDQGLSFNTAQLFNVNFYENMHSLSVNIPSPISNVAMNYYRYRLIGSGYNESGFLIHKIEVISKNPNGPAWSGHVYIADDYWLIAEADLWVSGAAINFELFDTFRIRQMNINVQERDGWLPGNQQLLMKGNLLGIKIAGYFTGVFSNYSFDDIPVINRRQTVIEYKQDAFELGSTAWESLRPIPLTQDEVDDYRVKDSLLYIRTQPAYMDSVDRESNKFIWANLAFGYRWQKRTKGLAFAVQSPFTSLRFNPVQGFVPTLETISRKQSANKTHTWQLNKNVQYGTAENKFRGDVNFQYTVGRLYPWSFTLGTGNLLEDYDKGSSLTSWTSSWINLRNKLNYKKYYSLEHVYFDLATPQQYPLKGQLGLSTGRRNAPQNNTNFSFWYPKKEYSANTPIFVEEEPYYFEPHTFTKISVGLSWQRLSGYMRTTDRIIPFPSNWPEISLNYTQLLTNGSDAGMRMGGHLETSLLFAGIPIGTYGVSRLSLAAGTFLGDKPEYLMDFKHFHGNMSWYMENPRFKDSYKLLPYYKHATTQTYMEVFFEHDFRGALFRHIPGVKKLGLSPVVSANAFAYEPNQWFIETAFGIDRIGFSFLRLFRFDVVAAWDQGNFQGFGFIISSNTSMFNLNL